MSTQRASTSFLAFSGTGKRQTNFETAMALASLNALLPDTAKTFYRKDQTRQDVPDCSGQELYKRILTGEIGDISVEFFATAKLVTLLAVYGMGVVAAPVEGSGVYTHDIDELPLDSFQPPPFSLVFGFKGGPTPLLLRACTLNSMTLRGRARQTVTGQANIKFAEGVPATGFSIPACVNEMPLFFGDCGLSVAGASQAGLFRSFEFLYNLRLLTGDHAHTDEGVIATRLERADQRERRLSYAILGNNSDEAYLDAEAGAEKSFDLRLGKPDANRVTFSAGLAHHILDGGGLRKDGEANETNIAVVATPMMNGANMPLSALAVNNQSTAYLITA
ncbi:MAG: hypothetical protein ABW208_07145 [Pyrinomonadaceae bacterium]